MMSYNTLLRGVVILGVLGTTIAFAGEYIPKAYYTIDRAGHRSNMVYLRAKRNAESGSGTGSSYSSSYSSGSGGAAGNQGFPGFPGGAGGPPGSEFIPDFSSFYNNLQSNIFKHIPQPPAGGIGGGGGNYPGGAQSYSYSSSSSGSGAPGGQPGASFNQHTGGESGPGPQVFSRTGEDTGSGIHVSGSATGEHGAYSSSSTSIDSNGKIKYSVQNGKF